MFHLGACGLAEDGLLYEQAIYGPRPGGSQTDIWLALYLRNISFTPVHGKSLCELLVSLPIDALSFVSHQLYGYRMRGSGSFWPEIFPEDVTQRRSDHSLPAESNAPST